MLSSCSTSFLCMARMLLLTSRISVTCLSARSLILSELPCIRASFSCIFAALSCIADRLSAMLNAFWSILSVAAANPLFNSSIRAFASVMSCAFLPIASSMTGVCSFIAFTCSLSHSSASSVSSGQSQAEPSVFLLLHSELLTQRRLLSQAPLLMTDKR